MCAAKALHAAEVGMLKPLPAPLCVHQVVRDTQGQQRWQHREARVLWHPPRQRHPADSGDTPRATQSGGEQGSPGGQWIEGVCSHWSADCMGAFVGGLASIAVLRAACWLLPNMSALALQSHCPKHSIGVLSAVRACSWLWTGKAGLSRCVRTAGAR